MDRLSAFFHLGPVLVTGDVPDFGMKSEMVQGNLPPKVVDRKESKEGKPRENGVGLPGVRWGSGRGCSRACLSWW